jgi:integrase/recombinase XerC
MSHLIDAYVRHVGVDMAPDTTIDDRRKLLYRLDRDLPMGLDQCTTEELEDWLANPSFSVGTRYTYYVAIKSYFGFVCDPRKPRIDYDPTAGLRRPATPKWLPKPATDLEVAHALAELAEPWRTYVILAAYAGARCAEVATIEKEAITPDRIRIRGKGNKTRSLRTHPIVWSAVEPFPAGRIARRINDDEEPTPDYISARTASRLRRIGLDLTLHSFRHWFATVMLRPKEFGGAGASLRVVQLNMGHESISTTAGYTAVMDEERDAGIVALPSFTSTPN